ncbi:MAG TPA: Holliday junction resolvase RuvX [Polyangiaceae bacterium]|nr:Holliday junction resolvase RuvX [Polyangiaceae bacterium]
MQRDQDPPARLMALDYGTSRIGVAISDELGLLAHPRPFIPAQPAGRALRLVADLVRHDQIGQILVGLPLHMNGTEGLSARRARKFAAEVETATGLSVHLVDERLSTKAAQGLFREAGRSERDTRTQIDSASAALLLQSWLDGHRGSA